MSAARAGDLPHGTGRITHQTCGERIVGGRHHIRPGAGRRAAQHGGRGPTGVVPRGQGGREVLSCPGQPPAVEGDDTDPQVPGGQGRPIREMTRLGQRRVGELAGGDQVPPDHRGCA